MGKYCVIFSFVVVVVLFDVFCFIIVDCLDRWLCYCVQIGFKVQIFLVIYEGDSKVCECIFGFSSFIVQIDFFNYIKFDVMLSLVIRYYFKS